MRDFTKYKAADFIQNEDFVAFVLQENTKFAKDWETIMEDDSSKKEALIAKFWIATLSNPAKNHSEDIATTKNIIWGNIVKYKKSNIHYLKKIISIAAIILLAIGMGIFQFLHQYSNKLITDYGAIKHFELPDSSSVELFGNSTIEYGKKWGEQNKREVWLTSGNAAFHIRHTAILNEKKVSDSFRVHYKDYTMTVMGTIFSVSTRDEALTVTLKEGKVRINNANNPKFSKILLPGQTIIINPHTEVIKSIKTPPPIETIHGTEELSINNKTVKDLLDYIQNLYGYRIQCNSPQLLDIKLEGTLPSDNIDEIILALSNMINATIKKDNTTIIINALN